MAKKPRKKRAKGTLAKMPKGMVPRHRPRKSQTNVADGIDTARDRSREQLGGEPATPVAMTGAPQPHPRLAVANWQPKETEKDDAS